MIKYLQKVFNVEKEPEMAQEETQAPVLAVDRTAELELAQASLADVQNKLAVLQTSFEDISAKHEQAQAALAVIEADKAQMIVAAQEAKQLARKEKVEATLGTAKAASVLEATATLEDAQFDAVVAAFAASYEAEANSPMFSEQGIAASAEVVEEKPVHFNTFINKK